jgi:hypothetical protein
MLIEIDEQESDRARAAADEILSILRGSDVQKPILLHGTNASAWRLLRRAIELGLSTRIGLEDVSTLPDGATAKSNAELVTAAFRLTRTGFFSNRS